MISLIRDLSELLSLENNGGFAPVTSPVLGGCHSWLVGVVKIQIG